MAWQKVIALAEDQNQIPSTHDGQFTIETPATGTCCPVLASVGTHMHWDCTCTHIETPAHK